MYYAHEMFSKREAFVCISASLLRLKKTEPVHLQNQATFAWLCHQLTIILKGSVNEICPSRGVLLSRQILSLCSLHIFLKKFQKDYLLISHLFNH